MDKEDGGSLRYIEELEGRVLMIRGAGLISCHAD